MVNVGVSTCACMCVFTVPCDKLYEHKPMIMISIHTVYTVSY